MFIKNPKLSLRKTTFKKRKIYEIQYYDNKGNKQKIMYQLQKNHTQTFINTKKSSTSK